jgi:hypothetical protein
MIIVADLANAETGVTSPYPNVVRVTKLKYRKS